jgi:hypothetical protein
MSMSAGCEAVVARNIPRFCLQQTALGGFTMPLYLLEVCCCHVWKKSVFMDSTEGRL